MQHIALTFQNVVLIFPNKSSTVQNKVYYIKMLNLLISTFSAVSLISWEGYLKGMEKRVSNGYYINEKNLANIVLNALYSCYSVLSWFPLPNVIPVLLASNFIGLTEHRQFLLRGLWSSFYNATTQNLVIIQRWNGYPTR